MILFLLLACSPFTGVSDRWSETWERCAPPEPFSRDYTDTARGTLTADCDAALAADFGVPESTEPPELREWLVEATYNLLARDMGQVQELEVGEWVRQPFLDTVEELSRRSGHEDVRQLLYNYAAHSITSMEASAESTPGFTFVEEDGKVLVNQASNLGNPSIPVNGAGWATSLFHEATHAFVAPHVPCPDDPDFFCDLDWSGAYGHQFAAAWLMEQRCDRDAEWSSCLSLEDEYAQDRAFIADQ
ncbi:MAG: hypothetical protein H6741_10795 [Alphaproteobacteria bacterium]|nr:hypothetical protein [Alphaproteobacteria bacterium]MCB9793203.1 hypothetical protein [Alphaproteobacteria bacterium]